MLMPNQRENMVRERAHKLWTEAEEPEGQDQMFWDRASKEIDAEESFGPDYLTRMEEEDARRREEEKSNVTDEDWAKREAEARQALAEQNRGRDPEQVRRERETMPPPPHRELTGEADNAGKREQPKRDTKAEDDKKVEKETLEREPVENSLKEESHRHQQQHRDRS